MQSEGERYGMDYETMMREIARLENDFPTLSAEILASSVLGRRIPCLSFGRGKRAVVYLGAHHGMEHPTSEILLSFVREILSSGRNACPYGVSREHLLASRRYFVVPMVNPDGVSLASDGIASGGILTERLLRMNRGSRDFTKWQANARGVDLNHNYDAGFWAYKSLEASLGIEGGGPTRYAGEYPESEPETAALARLVRTLAPELILTLHTQGEEIYYTSGGFSLPRPRGVAEAMARLAGYRAAVPEGAAAYGGLTDWAVGALGIPSYTVECGRGENPLPASALTGMRLALRPLLWSAPLL